MKKALLRVLLVICGLNVFTACYGVPPEDWPEPTPLPEGQEQTKSSIQLLEATDLQEPDRIDAVDPDSDSEKETGIEDVR